MKQVTVFAPATVANVAVGFDLLGFPISGIGDEITLIQTNARGIEISEITALPTVSDRKEIEALKALPRVAELNSATKGLLALMNEQKLDFGFKVEIKKGISLGSGMGGSAASAVGAIVAANQFLPAPLPPAKLFSYALLGEEAASGAQHGDNVSPCLYGGLTLTHSIDPVDIISIPVPKKVLCALVHPLLRVDTREARRILKSDLSLKTHVEQASHLAAFIAGCFQGDLALIGRSLKDLLIEPQRAPLVPSFDSVKAAALQEGALGCSLSGSGPSLFAWVDSPERGAKVKEAMLLAFQEAGIAASGWVCSINLDGAKVL